MPGDGHAGFIYKPGEGYWIRVMTLAMIALVVLTSAGWAYKSLGALETGIPAKAWNLGLKGLTGAAAPGQTITLLNSKGSPTDQPVEAGTAVVEQVSTQAGETILRIGTPTLTGVQTVQDLENQSLRVGGAVATISSVRPVPAFDIEYAQAGVAGVIVVLGVWAAYWFVGRSRTSVDFLIATDSEMRKVNWSTRREILGSTYVVIGATLLVALSLFLIDYGFSHLFIKIDLLKLNP